MTDVVSTEVIKMHLLCLIRNFVLIAIFVKHDVRLKWCKAQTFMRH
jgi:hypothetical protein